MKETVLISITLFIGLILMIFPLPNAVVWYRPEWTLMILLFWLTSIPDRVGIVAAWFVGMLVDLSLGTTLGLHALIYTLVAYFVLKFHMVMRGFSMSQKTLLILLMTSFCLAVQYWAVAHPNMTSSVWKYWSPILTTSLFWPWTFLLLRAYQAHFRIR